MQHPRSRYLIVLFLSIFAQVSLWASTDRYRCMWRDDPSSSMVIGWEQVSGENPIVYYDVVDWGIDTESYRFSKKVDRKIWAKGMHNHFARLNDLYPNTVYYFIIKDNESLSPSMSFKTAPNTPDERLSIIAGGDSRNFRKARCNANILVSKLRPHAIMFGGDMTGGDVEVQWKGWMDDWQNTIADDGRLTPIIVTRGNHESSNQSLIDLFDVKNEKIYYAFTFGGNLLRIYTLNSLIATGGDQKIWLENDFMENQHIQWKFAQYHYAIRPHTAAKSERNDQMRNWGSLFYKYGLDLSCESDAHVVKTTYPIRPSTEPGSEEGFIRDDEKGTVYIGEGCWGAPLRRNNDDKKWTRASGSFNQFKWIFVDQEKIEIRTVKTDNAGQVRKVDPNDIFSKPKNIQLWKPTSGEVLTIHSKHVFVKNDIQTETEPKPERSKMKNIAAASIPSTFLPSKKVGHSKKVKSDPVVEEQSYARTELYDLKADLQASQVTINWKTRNETNQLYFVVERSWDGKNFEKINMVNAKSLKQPQKDFSYQVSDLKPLFSATGELPVYRLKQILSTGEEWIYHPKIFNNMEWENYSQLVTDPRTGQLQFKYKLKNPADVRVRLLNFQQKEIIQSDFKNVKAGSFLQSIDVSNMPSGNYLLIIEANKKVIQKYQVTK